MIPTLPIEVTCPQCGTKYMAQVKSIIDVGQDPKLKALLLRGRLNTVRCPSCGVVGAVSTPLVYHDPDKELLLLFFPPQLNASMEARERLTGNLVNALMSTIPAERRKGYFLHPRTVLTVQSLVEEILRADGITDEMIERQRARERLLQDLLQALDDEAKLKALIANAESEIDYSFLLTLSAAAEESAAAGQQQTAERLFKLREALLDQLPIVMPEPLPLNTPQSEVLDQVLSTKHQAGRRAFVAYNRPLLDYAFFQELTNRIEQAPAEEAESLRALRTELLEMTERLHKEAQAVQQVKIQVLQDVLASPAPAKALRERAEEIDVMFLGVLAAAIRAAEDRADQAEMKRLQTINDAALELLQEGLPPELRLVNELLAAKYPEQTQQLLRERRADWSANLLQVLETLSNDLQAQGRTHTAQRLKDVRAQAEAILGESARQ